jgi:hypothetical protein
MTPCQSDKWLCNIAMFYFIPRKTLALKPWMNEKIFFPESPEITVLGPRVELMKERHMRAFMRIFWIAVTLLSIDSFVVCQTNQDQTNENIDQKWNDLKNKFINTAQNVGDGAVGFLKGMGQSVGIVTADYHYSFQVWNDTSKAVLGATKRIVPAMGTTISEDYDYAQLVAAFTNSGQAFANQQLYFTVVLFADPANSFAGYLGKASVQDLQNVAGNSSQFQLLTRDIYPWQKDDNNMYFYRVYELKGQLKAEYLGVKTASTDFLGMFYNSSVKDVGFSFAKGVQEYKVTLEAGTFNSLESTSTLFPPIRPLEGQKKDFTFFEGKRIFYKIPIAQEGIGNVSYNENTKSFDPAGPMLYTYEVFSGSDGLAVTIQGLGIGNFDQPVSGKLRDINPVQCHVWHQSAAQANVQRQKDTKKGASIDTSSIPYDAPETFWISYQTKDFIIKQKVEYGKILDFTLIRPQLKEKEAWLYGVTLLTNDEGKAKKFLDRLSAGKIGHGAVYTAAGLIGKQLDLSNIKANKNGIVSDTDPKDPDHTGVVGYVLFADSFLPTGVDSNAEFYYFVPPPDLRIDQLMNAFYLDDNAYEKSKDGAIVLKDAVQKELTDHFISWLRNYAASPDTVKNEVRQFVLQHGNKALFTKPDLPPAQRTLTPQAEHMMSTILTGPVSIANYPLMRKAGINYYVFTLGEKPDNWPS